MTKRIETLQDILLLSEDEFSRFLPDFALWFASCKATAEALEVPIQEFNASMVWTDDGANELTSITLHVGDKSFEVLDKDSK